MPDSPLRSERLRTALLVAAHSAATIGLAGIVAWVTGSPYVFPSLGPTAFLFYAAPTSAAASPRNTLLGHASGILAGWFALWVTGSLDAAPVLTGIDLGHVAAAAIALALTGAATVLLDASHPPAGATTLIVALGLFRTPEQLAVMMGAVLLVTAQASVSLRMLGFRYPRWRAPAAPS